MADKHALCMYIKSVCLDFYVLLMVILRDPLCIYVYHKVLVIRRDCHGLVTDCHLSNYQGIYYQDTTTKISSAVLAPLRFFIEKYEFLVMGKNSTITRLHARARVYVCMVVRIVTLFKYA